MIIPLIATGLLAAGQPTAEVLWAGHLEDASGPVDATVSASFTIHDSASGQTVGQLDEPTLLVVGGDFILELPVQGSPPALQLEAVINGVSFDPMPVEISWPVAAYAESVDEALQADNADRIGAIGDPVSLAALTDTSPTGARVAFANVTGVPADFLDGDDGLDLSPDSSFSFTGGQLTLLPGGVPADKVTSVQAADLATDAVRSHHVTDGAIEAADISGGIPLRALQVDALGVDHFSAAANRTEVFEVDVANCDLPIGHLSLFNTCTFTNQGSCPITIGSIQGTGKRNCLGICVLGNTSNCEIPSAGFVVFK